MPFYNFRYFMVHISRFYIHDSIILTAISLIYYYSLPPILLIACHTSKLNGEESCTLWSGWPLG